MIGEEWFRRTTWSPENERAFYSRLARSRSVFHKAQYLRIQAGALSQTGKKRLVQAALGLLERVFTEFPDPPQLAAAHFQAAKCHEELGRLQDAIGQYRLALDAQARFGGIDPGTAVEFPWFIVQHRLTDLYDDALGTLEDASPAFPVQSFKVAAVRAVVAEHRHDLLAASRHAREAFEAASLTQSEFRYHRDLGLVGNQYRPMLRRLAKLAAT
jgi:hypothetical protein